MYFCNQVDLAHTVFCNITNQNNNNVYKTCVKYDYRYGSSPYKNLKAIEKSLKCFASILFEHLVDCFSTFSLDMIFKCTNISLKFSVADIITYDSSKIPT